MTKSKSSTSSIDIQSIFVIHLVYGAQFLTPLEFKHYVLKELYHVLLECKHRWNPKD